MTDDDRDSSGEADDFERLALQAETLRYVMRLYVSGMTPRSAEAINNLTDICRDYLNDRYELEVIDIYKHPERAREDEIVATPTLVKELPLPPRRFIGTLAERDRLLAGLDLVKKG